MLKSLKKFITLLVLVSPCLLKNDQPMTVIYLHGIGTSCEGTKDYRVYKDLINNNPHKNPVHCVEYGGDVSSILNNINHVAKKACNIMDDHAGEWNLKNGYIIFGASQGNMIGRYILQECNIGQYVKRFISSGGPHMGVLRIPHTDYKSVEKILNNFAEDVAYDAFFQELVVPAGYFKSIRHRDKYLEKCRFLPNLNNEKTINQQYKDRMVNLEMLVAIKYLQDKTVVPKESEHFGYFADETETSFIKMEDTEGYKKDAIGLKTLNEAGKLIFHEADSAHEKLTEEQVQEFVIKYLGN